MKKLISLSLGLALLTALFTGCGTPAVAVPPTVNGVTPAVTAPPTANAVTFPEFQTTDLSGNAVDSSLFAENKLTMLNMWGTFCGPCIEEMPDLAVMGENMPEGTAIVGLITDALDEERIELAKKIVAETGVKYRNLITDEVLDNYITETVIGVPMTIFIDSSGNIVGDALIGARSMEVYTEELMARLKSDLPDPGKTADTPPEEAPDSTVAPDSAAIFVDSEGNVKRG